VSADDRCLDLLEAYLAANDGAAAFPGSAAVVIRCTQHGTPLGGISDTELGPMVVTRDSYDGSTPTTEGMVRGLKMPAGASLVPTLLAELSPTATVGGWCPAGGRIAVTGAALRSAWDNRTRHPQLRVDH
jgi:hypothetical protein